MSRKKLWRLCLLCGATLPVVLITSAVQAGAPADDGWRRTAQGWEQIMPATELAGEHPTSTPGYLHPLLLTALQATVIAIAYRRFPVTLVKDAAY